jgi:hypothetical protein
MAGNGLPAGIPTPAVRNNIMQRPLTCNELYLVRKILGNAANWSQVQIVSGAWWLLHPHAAITCGNRIVFPAAYYVDDFAQANLSRQAWLIHELMHVWQSQHGFPIIFAGVCLALKAGYYQARAYRYPPLNTIKSLGQLNMEQQAQLVQDYFLALAGDKRHLPFLVHFRRLLKPLIHQPDNRRLLPHY